MPRTFSDPEHPAERGHFHLDHETLMQLVQKLFMIGLAGALAFSVFTELLFGHIVGPTWR